MRLRLVILGLGVVLLAAGCKITYVQAPRDRNEGLLDRLRDQEGLRGRSGGFGQAGQPGSPGPAGDSAVAVRGSGKQIIQNRPVADFSKVNMRGSAQLFIDRTGTESLSIEAEDNLLPYIESEVRDGRLSLGPKAGASLEATLPIVFHLTVKTLDDLTASGSGQIRATNLGGGDFTVKQSGSFDISASGRVDHELIIISGSGRFIGDNLDATEAAVDISGSGDVVVKAGQRLRVKISGSGSVDYIGDPAVTQNVSGSGTVRKR